MNVNVLKRPNSSHASISISPFPSRGRAGWGGERRAALHAAPIRARNRGSSLIEVVIAMSVAAAMLAGALGVIHLLLRAERGATKNIVYDMTLNRLARTLRADVHAAKTIEIVPADGMRGSQLKLQPAAGAQVSYEISPGLITRTVEPADKPAEREQFRFAEGSIANVERLSNPDRVKLDLLLLRNPSGATAVSSKDDNPSKRSRSVQIEAVASRDYRFLPGEGSK